MSIKHVVQFWSFEELPKHIRETNHAENALILSKEKKCVERAVQCVFVFSLIYSSDIEIN